MSWSLVTTIALGTLAAGFLAGAWWAGRTRARHVEAVRTELAQGLGELLSLQELGFLMSGSLNVDQIVGRAAHYIHNFLRADGTLVAVIGEEGPPLRVAAAEGTLRGQLGRVIHEAEAGELGSAMGLERPVVLVGGSTRPTEIIPGVSAPYGVVAPLHAHGETVGTVAVVTNRGYPVPLEDQRFLSTVCTHTAVILANARFFEIIRDAKEQWETVFDALTDGIAVLDSNHQIRRANRALGELTSEPSVTLIDRHLCRILFNDGAELHALLTNLGKEDTPRMLTARSDKLDRTLRLTASPIRDTPLRDGWAAVLIEDVTEWQAIEARLIQNERMAAVGQLVSGVAHELNNPLTSIAGLAEFLNSKKELVEADREHLNIVREQAERANRIVGNLLTFARRGPNELDEVDLADLTRRVALLMDFELKLQEIDLETQLDAALPPILGDQYQLQQVVVNLLTNAVQAVIGAPPGRPREILLSTGVAGDRVFLRVKDSGPGITPDDLSSIFTPFFTTKEPGKGTGLGLSISFGIVEGHHGLISVEDTGPEGTTFRVELPVKPGGWTAKQRRSTGEHAMPFPAEPDPSAGGRRLLVVDPDPAVQRTIKALFSEQGQIVDAMSTAATAIERLEHEQYDLIIADPRTAVSAGEGFAEELLRRWPDLATRTILVTADVRPETTKWLQGLGCTFFRKPFNVRDFRAAAARVFGAKTAGSD